MVRTRLKKRNNLDVPEAVIQETVRAVQERRLSLRVAASRYGITHTVLHYRIKNSATATSAIGPGPVCLLRITQVGKFSMQTRN
jgi:hypothetical protein